MPLVRKPGAGSDAASAATTDTLAALASPMEETRWAAARSAAGLAGSATALAAALQVETSARVREAMFTSLARMGGNAAAAGVLPLLRSDDANLRTGALDALRIMVRNAPSLLPPLLADADPDVRILSCELARVLPGEAATSMLCGLLQHEAEINVCAAAVDVLAEAGLVDALPALEACTLKFTDSQFIAFAIQVAADRISSRSVAARG